MEKINKSFVKEYNKSRNRDTYDYVLSECFSEPNMCRVCSGSIYYYDSTFFISNRGSVELKGKSFLTKKQIDGIDYHLSVCEICLTDKFTDYSNRNKSRVFNQMSKITEYAFDIPNDVAIAWMSDKYAITEENLCRKWGNTIGLEKWESYRKKQSLSNKFEYKKEKHGWSEDDYDKFNKSRSITLETMVEKYGENMGLIKYNDYVDLQKLTKSKDYVVKKHGIDFWDNLCKSKSHTLENYISKYGDMGGNIKYVNFWSNIKLKSAVSKSSQKYLSKLDEILSQKYTTYYFDKCGKEYGKNLKTRWVYLDYFIKEININVEYNGDLFHANPCIFGPDDEPIPFTNTKASEIWRKDDEKIKLLYDIYGIRTIVIWESDLPDIENLVNIIENYENCE